MTVRFGYTRGKGARRRVAHFVAYDRFGNPLSRAACGAPFDTTCNLPLGLRYCKRCVRVWREAS